MQTKKVKAEDSDFAMRKSKSGRLLERTAFTKTHTANAFNAFTGHQYFFIDVR